MPISSPYRWGSVVSCGVDRQQESGICPLLTHAADYQGTRSGQERAALLSFNRGHPVRG